MNDWILQALALLLTAPWWLPLAKRMVHDVQVASGARAAEPADTNERAFERARRPWGAEAQAGRRVPKRLSNGAWETGRRKPAAAGSATRGSVRPASFEARPGSSGREFGSERWKRT